MAHRVLIIDDDRWIALSTRMVLEAESFEVAVATRPAEGIEAARDLRPDVILLDIMMPGYNGWELLERLKADPATAAVPVVVFSARNDLRGPGRARDAGAVEFVRKPYRPEVLVRTLRRHLPGGVAEPPSA